MGILEKLDAGLSPSWVQWSDFGCNIAIGMSFLFLSFCIVIFEQKRKDFQISWILNTFAAIIAICGLSHFFDAYNLWSSHPLLSGWAKIITAFTSVLATYSFWKTLPAILTLPSTRELLKTKELLTEEIQLNSESEERLLKILSSSYDGICLFDSNFNYKYWNSACERIYGWPQSDVVGFNITDPGAPNPKRGQEYIDEIKKWIATGESNIVNHKREIKSFGKGGMPIHVEIYVTPITAKDGNILFASFSRDIAEQKKLEELANRRTSELESFSYSVSHDLRGPLRTINGYSYLLSTQFGSDLPLKAKEYLELIQGKSEHMGRLIDDLLAFSRLGRQPMKKELINMNELFHMVWNEALEQENAQVTPLRQVDLFAADLPLANGDSSLITQVVINLLSNALKYTRGKTLARVEIGFNGTAYYVKDNGIGFNMNHATKLFTVFHRLHPQQGQFDGTGVGLAIVKKIVEKHDGHIWAESKPDQGATFFFTLGGA